MESGKAGHIRLLNFYGDFPRLVLVWPLPIIKARGRLLVSNFTAAFEAPQI
jgi:hypothetical protein